MGSEVLKTGARIINMVCNVTPYCGTTQRQISVHIMRWMIMSRSKSLCTLWKHGGDDVKYHSFLASTLDKDEWSASDPSPFTAVNKHLVATELDGTQSQPGCFGEEVSRLCQELTHNSPHIQSIASSLHLPCCPSHDSITNIHGRHTVNWEAPVSLTITWPKWDTANGW
jgi:hypothetical protein